jgi:hypothetical protein
MGVHLVFFNFERHGIDDAEIEWIEADVGANKESPSLLFFHVPLPIPSLTREVEARIGSDICLARGPNTDRFFRLLAGNPQILAIFCSHVHFNSVHRHGGTVQITTDRVTEDALRRVIVHGMGA